MAGETELYVSDTANLAYADCGGGNGGPTPALRLTYNVTVHGDSSSAIVKASAFWASSYLGPFDCVSRGTWEVELEKRIKARAEAVR